MSSNVIDNLNCGALPRYLIKKKNKININELDLRLCLVPKNVKENDFFIFGCPMKNIKENQI